MKLFIYIYYIKKNIVKLNCNKSIFFLCCQGNMLLLLTPIRDADLQMNHSLFFVQAQSGPVTS